MHLHVSLFQTIDIEMCDYGAREYYTITQSEVGIKNLIIRNDDFFPVDSK